MLGDDELEHSVAEELEALVIEMVPLGFVPQAGMRHRFREKKRIAKLMADSFLEGVHAVLA